MLPLVRTAFESSAALVVCMVSTLSIAASVDADTAGYLSTINAIPRAQVAVIPSRPILIAIVDDALNIDQTWLKPFIADGGFDVADDDADVRAPVDRLEAYRHGTFLVDAMVGVLRHTLGPEAHKYVKILPVKSLSDYSTSLQLEAAFKGVDYAISRQADIVVTAWAIKALTQSQRASLDTVQQTDTLLIASAGNERVEKTMFPAAHAASLSVGGLNQKNQPWQGSNRGDFVDLSAPAENISGTDYLGTKTITDSGTSFSTALVAAAAALVKVHNPDFSAHQIRACLLNESTAHDVARPSNNGKFGAGMLDVAAAVACRSINAFDVSEGEKDEPVQTGSSVVSRSRGYLVAVNNKANQQWQFRTGGDYSGIELHWATSFADVYPDSQTLLVTTKGAATEQITLAPGERKRIDYVPDTLELQYVESSTEQPVKSKAELTLLSYRLLSEKAHTRWCSGTTIITENVTLTDGSVGENYAANSDCKWLFAAPEGKLFEFEVIELDTESTVDQLHFFNGDGTHETPIGLLSGTERPPVFRSWNEKTLLWFVSDGYNEGKGWSINARIVEQAATE